jgi:hypothetical protein
MSSLAEIESAVDGLPLLEQEELFQRLARKLGGAGSADFPVREDHVRLLDERFVRQDPELINRRLAR